MIAHVAEAGEDRGRVVLRLGPTARHSDIAVSAAMRVAAAYGSELESLFVEDQQLFDVVQFPFVHEIVAASAATRALAPDLLSCEIRATASLVQRQVAALAATAGVRVKASIVRDDPVRALSQACSASGPWNVIVLGQALASDDVGALARLFDAVADATGFVVAGENASAGAGPVVVVVEDLARLPPMLRAAQKLAAPGGGRIDLVFVADDADYASWMESQARLAVGDSPLVSIIAADALGGTGWAALRLARLQPSFVIAAFGGLFIHPDESNGSFAHVRCPLFLVR